MADPQHAQDNTLFDRFEIPAQGAPTARRMKADETTRPRIGSGPRKIQRRRNNKIDSSVALRALAVSCTVAAVVLGGFFLFHGLGRVEEPASAPAAGATVVTAGLVPTTAPVAAVDAGRIAALLNHESAPPAPAEAPPPAPGPTVADFNRPAFLEPQAAEAPDADAAAPAETVPAPPAEEVKQAHAAQPNTPPVRSAAAGDVETTGSAGREGRIVSAINLRRAPQRGSAVIGTLAAGTKVTVYSCKSWCEVSAGDKRGFVYSRAVD